MLDFTKHPHVILVNEFDVAMGICEKVYAHQISALHRAISVYLKCGDKVLLQKRSPEKYHGGNLWANAACTHPMYNESNEEAAKRALQAELGISITSPLQYLGHFIYKEKVGDLVEHELDHVFLGEIDESTQFNLNPYEVSEIKFIHENEVGKTLTNNSELFSPWFPYVFEFIQTRT